MPTSCESRSTGRPAAEAAPGPAYSLLVAKRTRGDGGTPATIALAAAWIAFTARTYAHDPDPASYGLEAVEALGVEPARVLKTPLVEGGTGLAVGIVPVDRQLDLKAIATALGVKRVQMAEPRAAERVTGYIVGGISPIGQTGGTLAPIAR
jgi:Cys-tRNA(Pro)/Cys-tRNA(Cys) deacylase